MRTRTLRTVPLALCICLLLFIPAKAQHQVPYPSTPSDLKRFVESAVEGVFIEFNRAAAEGRAPRTALGDVSLRWDEMVLFAVADATATRELANRKLFVYRNLGETARADKQAGATATGLGSTSLLEKAGIPLLLAFAIEHGAIQQEFNGTTLTLSGSPYGWFALAAGGDTADNYDKYNFWTRFGVSATFNVQEDQRPSLGSLSTNQLSEYSVRVRLIGDRSPRSKRFFQLWDRTVGAQIQRRVNVISAGLVSLYRQEGQRTQLYEQSQRALTALLAELHAKYRDQTSLSDNDKQAITDSVLKTLWESIYRPIRDEQISIAPNLRDEIHNHILPTLTSIETDVQEARESLDKQLEDFYKSALLTFTYTNHRTPTGSDYSEFKLVFERKVAPVDVTANAGVSIYHDPDPMMGQQRVRDFHVSLSLQGQSRSPFRFSENDLSKTTCSLSGRYARLKQNEANIGVLQAKIEIPLGGGLSLPLSVTYATRSELIDEREVRGNFGVSFDLDKLYGLLRRLEK